MDPTERVPKDFGRLTVNDKTIRLAHGSGGRLTQELIEQVFRRYLGHSLPLDDSAVLDFPPGRLAFTTDAHVVDPIFFPGGDIGRLAVCGTVNDLAAQAARPLYLSAAFVLEEGFSVSDLERVVRSMRQAADEAGVRVVTGDTKVVPRGKGDRVYVTTSGVGVVAPDRRVSGANAQPGDVVLISGTVGDHGMAVISVRSGISFETDLVSDVAPLNGLVEALFQAGVQVHALRDPTRGGVATTLNEIARQSGVAIEVDEASVPLRPEVIGACELLGFDPLYVANEGKMLVFVPAEDAEKTLQTLRAHPLGRHAAAIGRVLDEPPGRVFLKTQIGGRRILDMQSGEQLPRIC